ncbi:MAG: hypothetical protein AMXMBFR22_17960 [Phycisphaerae bacterium]
MTFTTVPRTRARQKGVSAYKPIPEANRRAAIRSNASPPPAPPTATSSAAAQIFLLNVAAPAQPPTSTRTPAPTARATFSPPGAGGPPVPSPNLEPSAIPAINPVAG